MSRQGSIGSRTRWVRRLRRSALHTQETGGKDGGDYTLAVLGGLPDACHAGTRRLQSASAVLRLCQRNCAVSPEGLMSELNNSPFNGFKPVLTCSIIGSFRKHYRRVCDIAKLFASARIQVLSPTVSEIIDPEEWFVKLQTDRPTHDPVQIQLIALARILTSDFVYVVAPKGYVGRTTCYEIGRIVERGVKLYFSEAPVDLPILIPAGSIVSPEDLVRHLSTSGALPDLSMAHYSAEIIALHSAL